MFSGRLLPCLVLSFVTAAVQAQTPPIAFAYDVTTVKPHKPGDPAMMWGWRGPTYQATNVSLKNLIASAYGVRDWLVFNLPPWASSERYDVQAKITDVDPAAVEKLTQAERRTLLIDLLKKRFGLSVHQETKVQPVYELTVLPGGPKFQETRPAEPAADGVTPAWKPSMTSRSDHDVTATGTTLAAFAENLSYRMNRTILDKTGLTARYDFQINWDSGDPSGAIEEDGTGGYAPPDLFPSLREQLGLKLTPAKAAVPTVVVDKITQPEPN